MKQEILKGVSKGLSVGIGVVTGVAVVRIGLVFTEFSTRITKKILLKNETKIQSTVEKEEEV